MYNNFAMITALPNINFEQDIMSRPYVRASFYLGTIPSLPRHIGEISQQYKMLEIFPSHQMMYSNNITAFQLQTERQRFTQEILDKRNVVRSLTGVQLKRIISAIFQTEVQKRSYTISINNYVFHNINQGSRFSQLGYPTGLYGEDIASLWALHYGKSYVEGIQAIYNYLERHSDADLSSLKKQWWIAEQAPLALQLPTPWQLDSFIAAYGAVVFNYFDRGLLIGSACYHINDYGCEDIGIFYSLVRHHKSEIACWLPTHSEYSKMFFQKELLNQSTKTIMFCSNEILAFTRQVQIEEAANSTTVALACPLGLAQLPDLDLSICTGLDVIIDTKPELFQCNHLLLPKLIDAFTKVNARSLKFLMEPSKELLSADEFSAYCGLNITVCNNLPQNLKGFITAHDAPIPGAEARRNTWIEPLIKEGFICWLYGPEKVGKGWLSLYFAQRVAQGGLFLDKYRAVGNCRVLYIDGEMLPDIFEANVLKVLKGLNCQPEERKFAVKLAKGADNAAGRIDLSNQEWQAFFDQELQNYDVVILDNWYSLTDNKTNIHSVMDWIRTWTSKGKAFWIVDHTTKDGEALQGSSDKKRMADLCIELRHSTDGHIELSFPTARHLGGDTITQLTLRLDISSETCVFSTVQPASEPQSELSEQCLRVAVTIALNEKNIFPQDIALLLGYSNASVYAWLKKYNDFPQTYSQNKTFASTLDKFCSMPLEELKEQAMMLKK